jgi:hypothetical protein
MTAADLLALADRCEREEPSRELEVAIFTAIGLTSVQEKHCTMWCRQDGRTDLTRERYIAAWAPYYGSSLDAAVTLVPEGFVWAADNLSGPRAHVVGGEDDAGNVPLEQSDIAGVKTVALALSAAALRARSATQGAP